MSNPVTLSTQNEPLRYLPGMKTPGGSEVQVPATQTPRPLHTTGNGDVPHAEPAAVTPLIINNTFDSEDSVVPDTPPGLSPPPLTQRSLLDLSFNVINTAASGGEVVSLGVLMDDASQAYPLPVAQVSLLSLKQPRYPELLQGYWARWRDWLSPVSITRAHPLEPGPLGGSCPARRAGNGHESFARESRLLILDGIRLPLPFGQGGNGTGTEDAEQCKNGSRRQPSQPEPSGSTPTARA
ncbi:hypothetical protein K466DRAFT_607274, partial [Polyporus arcularius HHB13444]